MTRHAQKRGYARSEAACSSPRSNHETGSEGFQIISKRQKSPPEFAHRRKLFLTEQVIHTRWSWPVRGKRFCFYYSSSKNKASSTRTALPSIPGIVSSPPRNRGTSFAQRFQVSDQILNLGTR
jgi:hypothetical protein